MIVNKSVPRYNLIANSHVNINSNLLMDEFPWKSKPKNLLRPTMRDDILI